MKYFFDRHTDSLSFELAQSFELGDSEPLAAGVTLHVDRDRRPLLLEIQGASKIADLVGLSPMNVLPIPLEEIARRMTATLVGQAIWDKIAQRIGVEEDEAKRQRLAIPDIASPFSIR